MLRKDPEMSESFITEEKWDIFSKNQYPKKSLCKWQEWFEAREKPTRIEISESTKSFVLWVFQEWHVSKYN